MSLENPFLQKTVLTSTENKYLNEYEKFYPNKARTSKYPRKHLGSFIHPNTGIVFPKQQHRSKFLSVENKYLKSYDNSVEKSVIFKKIFKKKKKDNSEIIRHRKKKARVLDSMDEESDDQQAFFDRELLRCMPEGVARCLVPDELMDVDRESLEYEDFELCEELDLLNSPACGFGFGVHPAEDLPNPPACGFGFGAHPAAAMPALAIPSLSFDVQDSLSNSCMSSNLLFGSASGATVQFQQQHFSHPLSLKRSLRIPEFVKHTEFSTTHGMPIYHLKTVSVKESFEQPFLPLEIDQDLLKLQKIKRMEFQKIQLLNATSMALAYAPNFKDPNDSFRMFLMKCADDVLKFDPEFILKVALYARQELHIRSASNFLLSYSAFNIETRPYLKKYFEASIVLPSDWIDVAEQYLSFQDTRLVTRSLPSALKQVLRTSFPKFDEYQLAKYNRKKAKRTDSSGQSEKKTCKELKTFTMKQLIRLLHISSPVDHVMCLLGKKYPINSSMFQQSGLPGVWDSKKAGLRMKLPQPETWEVKVSCMGNKAEVWENLIDNSKLPYMAMIRNLKNLILSGISEKHHVKVLNYMENKNAVIKSKQLPIQFYTAFKTIDSLETKENDVSSLLLERYKRTIINAVEISASNNMLPIGGKTLLICDASITKNYDNLDAISNYDKKDIENCLIMGLMCLRACEDCKMRVIYGHDTIETIDVKDEPFLQTLQTVLCEKLKDSAKSSRQKSPLLLSLQMMLEQFLKPQTCQTLKLDHIIVFRGNSRISNERMRTLTKSFLNKYRNIVNPDLLYTQVDTKLSNQSYPDFNLISEKDVYLCGQSVQILKFIAERSDGGQLSYVDNIDEKYKLSNDLVNNSKTDVVVPGELLSSPLYTKIPQWQTAQIFISSTFKDMHAERDMIIRYVMPELKRRAASIFMKINEVDLRWGITESDCATKRATELCLIEAQRSNLLIGILGERYGTIYNFDPPDSPELSWVKDYPSGSSITELEMYAGALRDPHLNSSKAFFYFRNASFLSQVPQNWKKHFECENPESNVKLGNLKQKIRLNGFKVLDQYPCYYAGIVNNTPLVAGLEEFGETVLKDMWKAVYEMHENDPYLDEISEEDISQNELFQTHSFFVGEKTALLDPYIKMLKNEEGIFVLCGAAGCGKSSFIIRLLENLKDTYVVKFFIGVSSRSTDVGFMLQYITNAIAKQFPVSTMFPSISKDIVNQFPDILFEAKKACNTSSLTLIIDGLDHLDFDDQKLDWLPLEIPQGVKVVCTASDTSCAFKSLCERKKNGCSISIQELAPMQLTDREHLVRNHLQNYSKKLDESPFNNQMMQLVTKRDSGNPLYLQLACEFLRKFAVFDNLMSTLQSFPSSLPQVFEEILLQLENEYGSVLVQTALTMLSISKEGLEENEFYLLLSFALLHVDANQGSSIDNLVKQLQNIQPDDMVSQVKFRSFLHLLFTFIYGHTRNRTLSISCNQFEKAVKKYYLNKNYGRVVKYLHPVLAAYYKILCDPKLNGTWNGYSASSFRSLLYHLHCGMCYNELSEILCCHNFIEAAFHIHAADQLLEYFNLFLENSSSVSFTAYKEINFTKLNCYKSFISRNAHILYCSPRLLFQQALNEPHESSTYLETSKMKLPSFECLSRSSIADYREHTLSGFLKNIVSVAFDHLKPVALFGSEDGYLKAFDLSSKKITNSSKGHISAVTSICCVGKNIICTASKDNTLSIWNNLNYNRIAVLKGHNHYVTGCCSDSSGSVLFSSSWDSTVRVWSPVDGRQISIIDSFRCPLNCIDHHPELQHIACGLWNGNVETWDTVEMKKILVLESHSGSIKSVAYALNGINILSSTINSDVIIWSSTEGLKIAYLSGHSLPVKSISCSKADDIFVTAGEDCTLKVWPNDNKHSALTLSQCKFCAVGFMEFIQTSYLAIAFQNSDVWVVDIKDGHTISSFDTKVDPVTCFSKLQTIEDDPIEIASNKFNNALIFGTLSGKIMAFEYTSSDPEIIGFINTKVTAIIHCLRFILCGNDNGDVGVFSLENMSYSRVILGAHEGSITSLNFALIDEALNASSASTDKTLKLWKINTDNGIDLDRLDICLSKHKDYITCCCFYKKKSDTSDEKYVGIIIGSHDNNVILCTPNDEIVLKVLETSVVNVFYSKNYIMGCSSDGRVAVWSYGGKLISFIKSIEKSTTALTFGFREDVNDSEDFHIDLAYVDSDGSVVIKHPLQRTQLCSLEGHSNTIISCCSGENGEIISCSHDGTVNLWRVPFNQSNLLSKHSGQITGISLSSNNLAVSSDIHGTIILWQVDSASHENSLTYLANKTFPKACLKDVIWLGEDKFVCALNIQVADEEIYQLNILSCEQTSCDGNNSYILREVFTYYATSEITNLDYNKENDCIAAALKSGHVMLVTPDFNGNIFVAEDWVLAATFLHGNPSSICTSDPSGVVRCYNLTHALKKRDDVLKPYLKFEPEDSSDDSYYPTALCCDNKAIIYTGDSRGWLKKLSKESQVEKQVHAAAISSICVFGLNVFTSSFDKTIKGWNASTLDQVSQFHSTVPITCLAVPKEASDADHSSNHFLIFGTITGNVHLLMYYPEV